MLGFEDVREGRPADAEKQAVFVGERGKVSRGLGDWVADCLGVDLSTLASHYLRTIPQRGTSGLFAMLRVKRKKRKKRKECPSRGEKSTGRHVDTFRVAFPVGRGVSSTVGFVCGTTCRYAMYLPSIWLGHFEAFGG